MYVLDLRATNARMTGEVGGKAANLGELLHAGFRVPDGFCVTTAAYDRVAHEIDLGRAARRTPRGVRGGPAAR